MPHRQVSGAVAIHNLRHQNSPVRSPGHLPVLFHKQKIPGTIAIPGILVAAGEGFEPSHTESESAVLPLHKPAISLCSREHAYYYTKLAGNVKRKRKKF